ncbi:MAG: DUF932 domain-containing protein [Ignavibacteriaceae bacterium]|nr:DUF932 domain-containing protein [Ignavibacteriaceae bacterium]
MTTEVEQKLYKFMFPVSERKVFIEGEDKKLIPFPDYKALAREDNGRLISILSDSYKVVSNSEIIKPLMEQLHLLDNKWYIDQTHSFVTDQRMRLQVTFPDILINDGQSDIALSLFLHNSYNNSEGIRLYFGGIRFICGNGQIYGRVLAKLYRKHTKGIQLGNLKEQVEQTFDQIPAIRDRIAMLQTLTVNKAMTETIEKNLGKKISAYVKQQKKAENMWVLYNYLTYYISHMIDVRLRAAYQLRISRIFQL